MITQLVSPKFLKFLVAGTTGFITDAGILWLGTHLVGLDPYTARLISFSIAICVTWLLNNYVTFPSQEKRSKRHMAAYATVQISSFLLNYSLYSALVWLFAWIPLLALTLAAITSMFFSFAGLNFWVFKSHHKA
jgi:putative flippase GtrA